MIKISEGISLFSGHFSVLPETRINRTISQTLYAFRRISPTNEGKAARHAEASRERFS